MEDASFEILKMWVNRIILQQKVSDDLIHITYHYLIMHIA